jgi:Peptidase family C25
VSKGLIVLTCKTRIEARYGSNAYEAVAAEIINYRDTVQFKQPDIRVIVPDEPASAALWGITRDTSCEALSQSIRIVARSTAAEVGSVVLVGDDSIVPFFRVPNPIPSDGDSEIMTDNPYGCLSSDPGSYPFPELAVGRLVGTDNSLQSLLNAIKNAASLQRAMPQKSRGCAIGCSLWSEMTQAVAGAMQEMCDRRDSPSYKVNEASRDDVERRLLYFNLHGTATSNVWSGAGQSGFAPAMSPSDLNAADMNGTFVFASNCFGAYILGKTADNSCALALVRRGAAAVVGSTCFSYGAGSHTSSDVLFSDQLAQLVFSEFQSGGFGLALQRARLRYSNNNIVTAGSAISMNPREYKTSLQFICLGDPTL